MSFNFSNTPLHDYLGLSINEPFMPSLGVNDMRQALSRIQRDDATVKVAEERARHEGLSGEDKYVLLAFYIMLQKETFQSLWNEHLLKAVKTQCPAT